MTAEKEGVTLVAYNCRWRNGVLRATHRDFPSLEAAVEHANSSMGQPGFCDPIVIAKVDRTELLWDSCFAQYA